MTSVNLSIAPVKKVALFPVEAITAAKWWADKLRYGAKQQMASEHQRMLNPDSTVETDICEVLTFFAGRREQVLSTEQIEHFEMLLAAIITRRFIQTEGWERAKRDPNFGRSTRVVMTDYGACDELRAAFQAVGGGLQCNSVFPIKTVMWVSPGSVIVRCGYGANEVELLVENHS